MAGLTNAHTSRLNLVAYTHGPCTGEMSFEDASGNVLAGPVVVNLNPGQATLLNCTTSLPGLCQRCTVHFP
jgi:hypothetical protein